MFNSLRIKIKELAKLAVCQAEEKLGSCKGKEKNAMAIDFVISQLPVPALFKPLISALFSTFIDEAIELAVEYMKGEKL